MAQIIPMEQRSRAQRAQVDGGAQILFFPGVRYARMEEPTWREPSKPKGGGKTRKRRARG